MQIEDQAAEDKSSDEGEEGGAEAEEEGEEEHKPDVHVSVLPGCCSCQSRRRSDTTVPGPRWRLSRTTSASPASTRPGTATRATTSSTSAQLCSVLGGTACAERVSLARCKANKSEDDAECKRHQRAYRSICPGEWV